MSAEITVRYIALDDGLFSFWAAKTDVDGMRYGARGDTLREATLELADVVGDATRRTYAVLTDGHKHHLVETGEAA